MACVECVMGSHSFMMMGFLRWICPCTICPHLVTHDYLPLAACCILFKKVSLCGALVGGRDWVSEPCCSPYELLSH